MGVLLTTEDIRQELYEKLAKRKNPDYVQCPRRAMWTVNERDWRIIRANAILRLMGTPVMKDNHEYYLLGNTKSLPVLLAWRAGPWRDWWKEDLLWEAHCVGLPKVMLIWEYKDDVAIVELQRESGVQEPPRVGQPPRLRKDFPKSAVCWHCPVRDKCDAWDELHELDGGKEDWPERWRRS
jgi:hypothetical protein